MTTELENPWLPEFREHVYGLGLISLNYNLFESTLQYILWHYTSVATTKFFFDKWNNEERTAAIRHFAKEEEEDREVLSHIEHLTTYFSICAENRNILMHSSQSFSGEKPGPEYLTIEKRLRSGGKNVFHLDLKALRRVSNEIIRGVTYCVAIDDYLGYRRPLNRLMRYREQPQAPTLPNKPQLPRKLNPHRPVVNLQADSPAHESSQAR